MTAYGSGHSTLANHASLFNHKLNGQLLFGVEGSERMRLTSTGLGIGTSSPSYKLDVSTASTTTIRSISTANGDIGRILVASKTSGAVDVVGVFASEGNASDVSIGTTSNHPLIFLANNGEKMRLDSSGILLVGATSAGPYGPNGLLISKADVPATTSGKNLAIFTTNSQAADLGGSISLGGSYSGSTPYEFAGIKGAKENSTNNNAAGYLAFITTNSGNASVERARIDSSGNLLVGQTTQSGTSNGISLTPAGAGTNSPAAYVAGAGTVSTSAGIALYNTTASAYRFYVTYAGNINATNTTITAISDQRLKENIRDLDDGLATVMALKPRKFDWKTGKGKDIKNDRGFIAQEFETVFPDMIEDWLDPAPEGEEPYKAVRADLIPTLVKAIQEQQALITTLTARITALESA